MDWVEVIPEGKKELGELRSQGFVGKSQPVVRSIYLILALVLDQIPCETNLLVIGGYHMRKPQVADDGMDCMKVPYHTMIRGIGNYHLPASTVGGTTG